MGTTEGGLLLDWLLCRGDLLACLCRRVERSVHLTENSLMAKKRVLVVYLESSEQIGGGLEPCTWFPFVS